MRVRRARLPRAACHTPPAMPTHTFPCPFCGKKMGVRTEFLGRHVRCPHPQCNQKVLAPSPAGQPPAINPAPTVQPAPPAPDDLPVFNVAPAESVESIFGEHDDNGDDLFGSREAPKLVVPEPITPEPMPAPAVPPQPPKLEPLAPPNMSTVTLKNPFLGTAPPHAPGAATPLPPPAAPATPAVMPAAIPVQPAPDPWAGFETAATVAAAIPSPAPSGPGALASPAELPEPEPSRPAPSNGRSSKRLRSAPAPSAAGGWPKVAVLILLPYALLMTVLAVYGLFFKSGVPAGHPLSAIPDSFGEFNPAERKKSGKLAVPPDAALPPELRVALGEKLAVGQIEVEPVAVEERGLRIVTEGKNRADKPVTSETAPAFVLHLKVKNTSDDLLIHPIDPAFNRKVIGNDVVGTGLVVGKQTFWGGPIEWPFRGRIGRKYEAAQEADATPLQPGESREYVICTEPNSRIVKAVREAKDSVLWRVQVRRGRIDFRGRDIPVTAIIGVEFKPTDVKGLG